jgi:3'(2'), 5'-bisphosphate nucleotidase
VYVHELETAGRLAREAGRAAFAFYGAVVAEWDEAGSPVTAADHASNELIISGLREAFPADAILSEELEDDAARLEQERVWIVDPLDGTKEFLAQNGEFAVMIGLAVRGEAVLGAVHLPATDTTYLGAVGVGAWREAGGVRQRIACRAADGRPLRLVGSRSHGAPLFEAMRASLGITDVAVCGSVGVKCVRIVEGERDLYLHPVSYLKEWDTCAPEALVRAAGGSVTDCLGMPLRYNKPVPVQPHGIVACVPGELDAVLERVRRVYLGAAAGEGEGA